MSLITPDFGLIFWMTIIFAFLFFILAKFGFPVITRMVDQRSARIEDSLRKADEAEKKLSDLAREQEEMIDKARAEQGRILREASKTGDAIIAQAKEQAQKEAAIVLEHAKQEIAAERESAIRDIRAQVAMISMDVAEKVLRKDLEKNEEQTALLDKLVDEASKAHMS